MSSTAQTEYWLRGPVSGIPDLLQPVAHAILQARNEIERAMNGFSEDLLWLQPAGNASVSFHLQHIPGVLDRLFTYARGELLNDSQLKYMAAEGKQNAAITTSSLLSHLNDQVDKSLEQLKVTDPVSLMHPRGVGRKQVPSTVAGLLFHAAEHTMRHTGQLLVTVKFLSGQSV
jgi:uncharacterized damage-inducible protein DinB